MVGIYLFIFISIVLFVYMTTCYLFCHPHAINVILYISHFYHHKRCRFVFFSLSFFFLSFTNNLFLYLLIHCLTFPSIFVTNFKTNPLSRLPYHYLHHWISYTFYQFPWQPVSLAAISSPDTPYRWQLPVSLSTANHWHLNLSKFSHTDNCTSIQLSTSRFV